MLRTLTKDISHKFEELRKENLNQKMTIKRYRQII